MSKASTTSPFMHVEEDNAWIIWAAQTDVFDLPGEKQTDSRSVYDDIPMPDHYAPAASYTPIPIQRNQYNAVLDRMNRASRKTGGFSAWNT